MTKRTINIYGARQNNLKNISLKIPKHKIVVFTGVSGSGKSSLVFETIGAEAQRQINETDNIFVLDEPSTGLHPSDTEKLISLLNNLVEKGNTVIVIEHNLDIISQADWIVDIGPLAGDKGGELVFSGTVSGLLSAEKSLTGYYLKKYLEL